MADEHQPSGPGPAVFLMPDLGHTGKLEPSRRRAALFHPDVPRSNRRGELEANAQRHPLLLRTGRRPARQTLLVPCRRHKFHRPRPVEPSRQPPGDVAGLPKRRQNSGSTRQAASSLPVPGNSRLSQSQPVPPASSSAFLAWLPAGEPAHIGLATRTPAMPDKFPCAAFLSHSAKDK